LLALLGTAGWVFQAAWQDFRADLGSAAARRDVAFWLNGGPGQPDQARWQEAADSLLRAVGRQDANPTLHDSLGDAYMVAASQPWATPELKQGYLPQAIAHYQKALQLRPRDARSWAALAMAYALHAQTGPALHTAWANARAYGPHEGYVMRHLLLVVLMVWDDASEPMRQWVTDLFERGSQAQRDAVNHYARRYGLAFSSDQPPKP
jgi:tetratricopeptide (TPR) repeat protein